jgi:hypothetical protein
MGFGFTVAKFNVCPHEIVGNSSASVTSKLPADLGVNDDPGSRHGGWYRAKSRRKNHSLCLGTQWMDAQHRAK